MLMGLTQGQNQQYTDKQNGLEPAVYSVTIEGCPSQLLKTVASLRTVNMHSSLLQVTFTSFLHLQQFTRILNRELSHQKNSNQFQASFYHTTQDKIQLQSIVKNQSFVTMKKIKFCSLYHVILFVKFYQNRLKQMQKEYRYIVVGGLDGFLLVYLSAEEEVSSMFLNQIREMKKKLKFFEAKDERLCEKFFFSTKLCQQLEKLGVLHEIWYRGKESTIIFYSQTQPISKIKCILHQISHQNITILPLTDSNLPLLINQNLLILLKNSISEQICKLSSIQSTQFQLNQDKLAIILHDKHEIFSKEIVEEILEKMKLFLLVVVRGKNARRFYNLMRNGEDITGVTVMYHRKVVFLCINLGKFHSLDQLKKIFQKTAHIVDHHSQIIFSWFHLQHESLQTYRKQIIQKMINLLSQSWFHVQNFQKLIRNHALKCSLKLKNINKDIKELSKYLGDTLSSIAKIFYQRESITDNKKFLIHTNADIKIKASSDFIPNNDRQSQNQLENDSQNTSQYNEFEGQHQIENYQNPQQQLVTSQTIQKGLEMKTKFSQQLYNLFLEKQAKSHKQQQVEWKLGRVWIRAEELLLEEAKIIGRIRQLTFSQAILSKIRERRDKLLQFIQNARSQIPLIPQLQFYSEESYSPLMQESLFYCSNGYKKPRIICLDQLKAGEKFIICVQLPKNSLLSYPVCMIQVIKRQ